MYYGEFFVWRRAWDRPNAPPYLVVPCGDRPYIILDGRNAHWKMVEHCLEHARKHQHYEFVAFQIYKTPHKLLFRDRRALYLSLLPVKPRDKDAIQLAEHERRVRCD